MDTPKPTAPKINPLAPKPVEVKKEPSAQQRATREWFKSNTISGRVDDATRIALAKLTVKR